MSRGLFHHDNRSRPQVGLQDAPRSPPLRRESQSDSDIEMTVLTDIHNGTTHRNEEYASISEDELSDDDDPKEARFQDGRRGSASTTQSYMLYTPNEEKAVIRKFDRRLVLFLAFLYMLSFLDRSSKFSKRCYYPALPLR